MEKSTLIPWDHWPKYKLVARPVDTIAETLDQIRNDFRLMHPDAGN